MKKGIDVSQWQGEIDWQKVKEWGAEFALIRAGYGRFAHQEDRQFKKNIAGAAAAGIPAGVYWYSYAVTEEEAEEEAKVCLAVIGAYRERIGLPVFFDQEYEPGITALKNKARTDICLAFLKRIRAEGYRAGLYCSLDWWENRLERERLAGWPLWIARYGGEHGCDSADLVLWQYSSQGEADGIGGKVDLNEGYDGLFPADGWLQAGEDWYYLREGRYLRECWVEDGGWRYRLGGDGRMATGWVHADGKLWWCNEKRAHGVPKGACIGEVS